MFSIKFQNSGIKKFFISMLLIISLSQFSCEELTYSPSGDNNYNLVPPDLSMELNLEEIEDSALVWGTVRINYTINTYGKEFRSVECYLDSELVSVSYYLSSYLEFDSRNYSDGTHSIILLLTAESGSGSLADKLGSEYVVLMKEFVMVIQNEVPPTPVTILNIETSSGYAKLLWSKYAFSNFESYNIYTRIFVPPYNYYTNITLVATIENKDSIEWIDDVFVGGDVTYTIDVITTDGTLQGIPFRFVSGAQIVGWEDVDGDSVSFTWSRCTTDSTFDGYELYAQSYPWGGEHYSNIASINDINDTIVKASIGFGLRRECFIKTVSTNSNNQFLDSFSPLELVYTGSIIPEFNNFEYVQANNSIYLTSEDSSFRLDATTQQVLAKGKYEIDVSFDGTRGYAYKDLSQIVEIDPFTLNEIRIIDLQDLLTGNNKINAMFTGKPNIVYCNTYDDIKMIDVDAHEIISKRELSWTIPSIELSSPHGYLIIEVHGGSWRPYLIEIDLSLDSMGYAGDTMENLNSLAFSYSGNLDVAIDTDGNKIWTSTHNGQNYVTTTEFNIPEEIIFPSRDPVSGLIGGIANGEFVIYDVNSQSEFRRIKLSPVFDGRIFLFDSKVYGTYGTYMQLD